MSVLLQGLSMPKNGWTDVRLHCDGSVTMPTGSHPYYRLLSAFEVPTPHGRLIDAKALTKDLGNRWNVNDDQDFCNKEVWHGIEEAPTIIPAEEGE